MYTEVFYLFFIQYNLLFLFKKKINIKKKVGSTQNKILVMPLIGYNHKINISIQYYKLY